MKERVEVRKRSGGKNGIKFEMKEVTRGVLRRSSAGRPASVLEGGSLGEVS